MRVQTWQQDQFLTCRRYLHKWPGDFWSIDEFIPSIDGQELERAPGWTGHIDLVEDFDTPTAAFYDESDDRFAFTGSSTELGVLGTFIGTMLIEHDALTTLGVYTLGVNTGEKLGGNHKFNAYNIMGYFWTIDENGDVFQAADPYATSNTVRYNLSDAIALLPIRDTIFLFTDSDVVKYCHRPNCLKADWPN